MRKEAIKNNKIIAITATTGIAAELLNGQTIHSFLKFPYNIQAENISYFKCAENLTQIDILIIDEISMMGKKFVKFLFECIKCCNRKIQLILTGDFYQLPPVNDDFAFNSPYWNKLNLMPHFLKQIVRQNDKEFIQALTQLRVGNLDCQEYLKNNSSPVFFNDSISLCATKKEVDLINTKIVNKINSPQKYYRALCLNYETNIFSNIPLNLRLKIGMRVMSIINSKYFSNGSIGTIIKLFENYVIVKFDNDIITEVFYHDFYFEDYYNDKTIKISQIPLFPAYAITIHKSQGQTFERVNIDCKKCWSIEQIYVAISRAKYIGGIHFINDFNRRSLKKVRSVDLFYKSLRQPIV